MSSKIETIQRKIVGETPIILSIIERYGIGEVFQRHIASHGNEIIPASEVLLMLLCNITSGRQPLYELSNWVCKRHPGLFGYEEIEENVLNDDRFGRALDKLYDADRATMMTEIVISMVRLAKIDLNQINNDATTVKAFGKIPGVTKSGLELKRGNSKDHRSDLKQLVFSLSLSNDGAVPVHYKTYSGNRTDDTTHIETWNTLRNICGQADFLYVADCKVCTTEQLSHIVGAGGRVVSIIPETWKEISAFKDTMRKSPKQKKLIWRRPIPGDHYTDKKEYFSVIVGQHRTHKAGYVIHWIYSSEKRKRDREARAALFLKAEKKLTKLMGKLNVRNLKSHASIQSAADEILERYKVKHLYHIQIHPIQQQERKQIGMGRPGPKTKYRTITSTIFSLAWNRDKQIIAKEMHIDGLFPLLTTDQNLSALETLKAYKFQPRLEKRFMQFKSVHNAAPLLFKKIERVESIMFLFFNALIVQALIERTIRNTMKDNTIESIPLYPENRICYHPTTAKTFDAFADIAVYCLSKKGQIVQTMQDSLSDLNKTILSLLGLSESEYWQRCGGK